MVVSVTHWGCRSRTRLRGRGRRTRGSSGESRDRIGGTPVGPEIDLGAVAMLTGVAVDDQGRVFVGVFNFTGEGSLPQAILRVTTGNLQRDDATQGLDAQRGCRACGSLYVTDSQNGCIWKGSSARPTPPRLPWFESELLAPGTSDHGSQRHPVGKGAIFVSSYDRGLILRIPVGQGKSSGAARVVADDPPWSALTGSGSTTGVACGWRSAVPYADSTDENGTARHQHRTPPAMVVVGAKGHVRPSTTPRSRWTTRRPSPSVTAGRSTLLNGSYLNGTPNLVAFTR